MEVLTLEDQQKLLQQQNEQLGQKKHESKPVRAAVGSALSLPAFIPQLAGMATSGVSTLFNNKSYLENLQDSSLYNFGSDWIEGAHNLVGANQPEEYDQAEKWASFGVDLVPTIASFGTYGAIKLPASLATKGVGKALRSKISKDLKNKLQKEAQKRLQDAGTDKLARLDALKQAKVTIKDKRHPITFAGELLLPGLQISKTEPLVRKNVLKGMTKEHALDAARKTQLLEGSLQAGIMTGAYEGTAALTDTQGLFGNYKNDPDDHSLQQLLNNEESSNLVPALVAGLGAYVGYRGIKHLTKDNVIPVLKLNDKIQHQRDTSRFTKPNEYVNDTIASNYSDRSSVLDNPEFNYLLDDEHLGLVRSDLGTTVNKMYETGDVGFGIQNKVPFKENYESMVALRDNDPERYNLLMDYIDKSHIFQNTVHDYNIKATDLMNSPDYSRFLSNEQYLDAVNNEEMLKLRKDLEALKLKINADPELSKLLQNLSDGDKVILKLNKFGGKYTDNEYNYLLKNRDVGGTFTYKPRIAKPDDKTFLQKIQTTVSGLTTDRNTDEIFGSLLGLRRTDFNPNMETLSYLDTYILKVKQALTNATTNSIKAATLPHMLRKQEAAIIKHYDSILKDKLDKWKDLVKNNIMSPEQYSKVEEVVTSLLADKASKATRVRYIGFRNLRNDVGMQAPSNVFDYKEQSMYKGSDTGIAQRYFQTHAGFKNTGNINQMVDGYAPNKNTKIISYFDTDGTQHFFEVHKLLYSILDYNPEMLNALQHLFKTGKQIFQKTTTGNLNPVFSFISPVYSAMEGMTALPTLLAKSGYDYNMLNDNVEYLHNMVKAVKQRYTYEMTSSIVSNWKQARLLNKDPNVDPILVKYSEAEIKNMELMLENMLLSKAQRAGAVTFKYSDEFNDRTFNLDLSTPFSEKFTNLIRKVFGSNTEHVIKMFGVFQECLRNAGNDAMLLTLAGKSEIYTVPELRKIADRISKSITDTKRRGNYADLDGALIGGIARYVSYGNTMIQSIAAKLHAAKVPEALEFIKTAAEQVRRSDKKWIDILTQVQIGAGALKNNEFIHGLVVTAGIPAVICYIWNHSTDSQRESYYKLSDYDKSSKYILTNFFGKGRHLAMPVDQEVGVFAKLVETMLDSVVLGSKMQDQDPAFEQHRLILQALARSMSIENLVYPELILNASGYQSNFGPTSVVGNESLISAIPPNQTNLDGSKTAIQDGVFSQEARSMINTIFGALGNTLSSGIEQANIGTRDVGVGQGASDFFSSTSRSLAKSIPFIPMDNKFTIRSSNQTQQQNKLKQNTIQSLRKLRTFTKNDNNSEFGRRVGDKVMNVAQIRQLSPELQGALSIADVAVPYYNEKIAPLYDKISATYKQVAAYNATGRDRFGNVVSANDRISFQQRQNETIQKYHAMINTEFKKLEQQLTNMFGRDITLDDFNKLKG